MDPLSGNSDSLELASESLDAFMWGFSSSSYQYEDPAVTLDDPMHFHTDWDLFYHKKGKKSPRENGIWGWSHFDKEVQALQLVGATHYRFSIEWARVEPSPGVYNPSAIQEYVRRAEALLAAGIVPVVCLWHFTFPSWATELKRPAQHGWLNPELQRRWGAYVRRMVAAFGERVNLYAPQNEPNNVARGSFLWGVFPPGQLFHRGNYRASMDLAANLFLEAAQIIRSLQPQARIISVQNVFSWDAPLPWGLSRYVHHFHFRHLDQIAASLDYLGFNYFTKEPAGIFSAIRSFLSAGRDGFNDLGWPISPDGLYQIAKELHARYALPLIVTENGIADTHDLKRGHFLVEHLKILKRLETEGVPIRGYFHWSLADNYEWGAGFAAKFGIFCYDHVQKTLQPKQSAWIYQKMIDHGWHKLGPELTLADLIARIKPANETKK